ARRGAADSGEYRQASRLATLKPRQRRGDARSEKKSGAIQVGQAHTVGWSAGHNSLKRVRTGAGAECFSLAEETPHAVRRTRTPKKNSMTLTKRRPKRFPIKSRTTLGPPSDRRRRPRRQLNGKLIAARRIAANIAPTLDRIRSANRAASKF